jgi:hypothetical protein
MRHGGRGKKGFYVGIWCDSSWELAWILFSIDHGVSFRRNEQGFDYLDAEGISRKYHPDFILGDGSYIEIKGWKNSQHEYKLQAFPHPIQVLEKQEMKPILDYVQMKYGKDFINLLTKVHGHRALGIETPPHGLRVFHSGQKGSSLVLGSNPGMSTNF